MGLTVGFDRAEIAERLLAKRERELDTLYSVEELISSSGLGEEELLAALIDTLPLGWTHADVAGARIVLGARVFAGAGFCESSWMQVEPLPLRSGEAGRLELAYREPRPAAEEGPFLLSERRLLRSVAARVAEIVEREGTLAALNASNEQLSYVLSATGDAVWDSNLNTGYVKHNLRWCELLGFPQELLEHPVGVYFELIHPEDIGRIQAEVAVVFEGRADFHCEYRIRHAQGHYLWIFDHGRVVEWNEDGSPRRMIGAFSDITARKQAEELLRLQTDVIRNMQEGVNLVDAGGRIIFANPACDAMFGYAAGESIGLHISTFNAGSGEDAQRTAALILDALRENACWTGEVHNRRKDGGEFWTYASVTSFHHYLFGLVWLTVQSDITEIRQLRLERDEAHQALERLSAHIRDDMEGLRRALASEVHDEIGASLTGIRMQLEALKHGEGQGLSSQLDMIAERVAQAVRRTRRLCTDLRPPMLDDLGLIETCRWYLADWSSTTGIQASGRWMQSDAGLDDTFKTDMFRILQELLTNVAKHANATRVWVTLSRRGARLSMRVRDNGAGFVPREGGGFGLSGIRERARRHGGGLIIDSAVGRCVLAVEMRVRG